MSLFHFATNVVIIIGIAKYKLIKITFVTDF